MATMTIVISEDTKAVIEGDAACDFMLVPEVDHLSSVPLYQVFVRHPRYSMYRRVLPCKAPWVEHDVRRFLPSARSSWHWIEVAGVRDQMLIALAAEVVV